MSKQIYAEITAKIVAQLEKGVAPWVRPWSSNTAGGKKARWQPHNLISNRDYRGINAVLLMMTGSAYPTGAWATYKQIKAAGGQVRKGEKATQVVYFDMIEVTDRNAPKDDPDRKKRIPLLRYFSVFNHAQADWEKDPLAVAEIDEDDHSGDDVPAAEATIDATGANISYGGDSACYIPVRDAILIPAKKSFRSTSDMYATVFHELTHWTAHRDRCNRDLTGRFGDAAYAFEELVAEMGAAFLCATHRIDGKLQHAEYIGSWIKKMREDDQAVFRAAALAQKAADFVMGSEEQEEKLAA